MKLRRANTILQICRFVGDRLTESVDDQMLELGGIGDASEFVADDAGDIGFDGAEGRVDHGGGDIAEDGEGLEGGGVSRHEGFVKGDARAEGFEVDGLVGVVGDEADEFAGGEGGDAGDGDIGFELMREGEVAVGGGEVEALAVLHGLAEAFGEPFGCVAGILAGQDVAAGVENDVGEFAAVGEAELAGVLSGEGDGDLVGAPCGDRFVDRMDEDGAEFVEDFGEGVFVFSVAEAVYGIEEQ